MILSALLAFAGYADAMTRNETIFQAQSRKLPRILKNILSWGVQQKNILENYLLSPARDPQARKDA